MKRAFATVSTLSLLSALVASTAPPATAASTDPVVVALRDELLNLAGWYDDLAGLGALGEPLPLLDATPGGARALDLGAFFGTTVPAAIEGAFAGLATGDGLDAFAAALTTDPSLAVTAIPADPAGISGLDVTISHTVTTTAPLLVDIGGVELRSGSAADEIGVTYGFGTSFELRRDADTGAAWIVHRPSTDPAPTPHLAADATVDFDFSSLAAPFESALGIARVHVTDTSTFDLDADLALTVDDTDGDGRLAFMEPAEGGGMTPGELTLPLDQNVDVVLGGTLAATFGLTTDLITPTGLSGTPQIAAGSADLGVGVDLSVNPAFEELAPLASIDATDLLGGLGQLSLALTGLVRGDQVDVELPFTDASLADALPVAEDLMTFVLAHSLEDDPETLEQETGRADFTTLDQLVEAMEAELPGVPSLAPVFDIAGQELALPFSSSDAIGSAEPITVPDVDGTPVAVGSLEMGHGLAPTFDWLSGLSSSSGAVATRRFGYEIDLTWGIDLRPATDCAPCDDPFTESFVETEDPPIYRRFLIGGGSDGPELELTALVEADASSLRGSVGFVGVQAQDGSALSLGSDSTPVATVDLLLDDTSTAAPTDLVPVYALLRSFGSDDDGVPAPLPGYAVTVTPTLALPAAVDLVLGIPVDGGLAPIGGADTVGLQLTWTDILADPVPTTDTSTGDVDLLIGFDLSEDPDALLGVLLDHIGALADELAGFADGVPILDDPIPFTSVRPAELVSQFDELATAIDTIRSGVEPTTLQEFVAALDGEIFSDALSFSVGDVEPDGVPDLLIDLQHQEGIDANLPLSLDLGAIGDLVSIGSSGSILVGGTVDLDLRFPIPVSLDGLPASPVDLPLDESSTLDIDVSGHLDSGVSLNLAGVSVGLAGTGEARLGLGLDVTATDADADALTTVGEFLTNLPANVALTPAGGLSCTVEGTSLTPVEGDLLCAAFPVELEGTVLDGGDGLQDADLLRVSASSFDPTGWSVEPPTGLSSALSALALDLGSLPGLVDRLATLLTAAMRLGGDLPVVGESLDAGADVVAKIQQDVKAAVEAASGMTGTVAEVRAMLEGSVAQTLADSGLLLDSDYDGALGVGIDAGDVLITILDGSGSPFANEAASNATAIGDVRVEFGLGEGDVGDLTVCPSCVAQLPLDLGLPALNIRTDGTLQAGYAWFVHLGIGVSRADGPYVLENPRPPLGGADAGDTAPELQLHTEAGMVDDIAALIGVFEFAIEDRLPSPDASGVTVDLVSNLNDPNGSGDDDRITLAELPGLVTRADETFDPSLEVVADFELYLTAELTGGLPQVRTALSLDWAPFGPEPAPVVDFGQFEMNLGSLFSETFGPILGEVRRLTKPVDPIREFLFSPLPVLSELSRMFGGDDVTFVDLAEIFGEVDLSLLHDINDVVELAGTIADASIDGTWFAIGDGFFVDPVKALQPEPTASQAMSLVSYDDPTGGTGDKAAPDPTSLKTDAANHVDGTERLFDSGEADFSLPVLDDPSCLFGMVLGGDCTVLEWTPDPLELEFEYEQPFGPFFGVLYVTVGGYAGAGARAGIGFDTHGARRLVEAGQDLGAAVLASAVLDGVFLVDFDGPELYVTAGITAGAKLDVLVAEAGARGGVSAALGFDLRDGPEFDGKLRIEEILDRIHNPLCLFDIVGALEAFLEVYVEIGVCPFCAEKSFELARVVLLDFSAALFECDADPLLARKRSGTHPAYPGDTLPYVELIVGALADPERRIMKGEIDENFTVRELRAPVWEGVGDSDNRPGLYSVTAFGHTQTHDPEDETRTYEGYWVRFEAGNGNDALLFQGSKAGGDYGTQETTTEVPAFQAPVVGSFDSGTNVVTTGEGPDEILGGSDTDQITLLGGNDTADGRGGGDTILGGFGTDTLNGDDGDDTLDGGPGGDTIDGGAGEDRIDGGRTVELNDGSPVPDGADLADTIEGGTGDDLIFAGEGGDTIYGDDASDAGDPEEGVVAEAADDTPEVNDEIHGEEGDDTIYAGKGNDLVYGDVEDEDAAGDPTAELCDQGADDIVYGQGGEDVVHGSRGCDELHGGSDGDELYGGPGDDDLFGDGGDDDVYGATGDDDIYGGTENDHLYGDEGNDDIVGNLGEDHAYGGLGTDWIAGDDAFVADGGAGFAPAIAPDDEDGVTDHLFGGDDDDHVFGQGGDDEIRGGRGADTLFGNGHDDDLFGDRDDDLLYGNAGADDLEGGPEDDLLFGNDGSDHLYGQAGDDRLVGGSDEDDPKAGSTDDAGDFLYGGAGTDVLLGDNGAIGDVTDETTIVPVNGQSDPDTYGDDELEGGADDDVLHGQDGSDSLWGGTGDDQLFGELHGDHLFGQDGHDVMLGDRGTVTPAPADPAQAPDLPGGAPDWTVTLVDPDDGGVDDLHGGTGDDRGYGGAANDLLEGGVGDDHLEGNGGQDEMYGLSTTFDDGVAQDSDTIEALLLLIGSDQDDLIGGSSTVHPTLQTETGARDAGETVMLGNAGDDVMAGDNADIDKVVADGDPTAWAVDDVTGGHLRAITLWDREKGTTTTPPLADVSGGDRMLGNDQNDRMYGQGGADVLKGNAHDDFVQGNQGGDLVEGNDGEDDLIGGSEFANSPTGDPDGSDAIHGGAGADVMLGDNGIVTRTPDPAVTYSYVTTQLGIGSQRAILLLDLDAPPDPANFGDDLLSGGDGVDVQFGQDGDDTLSGGPDDDYQEGNGGTDGLFGDRLPSDASVLADATAAGLTVLDLDAGITPCAPPFAPGPSCLSAAGELDGPVAGDGSDDGQDDQIGGSSRTDHRDDGDVLYGDGRADFQLGDNGELLRTIAGGEYLTYVEYNPTTIVRQANRFDVGGPDPDASHGDDLIHGNDGDDYQWGQDGDDEMYGDGDNDDMYGELGDDEMYGGPGEDAMVGDRGVITDRKVVAGDEVATASASVPGPTFLEVLGLRPGDLDRRVDLLADGDGDMDGDGDDVESPGLTVGGHDRMRGGPDHDVMHGAFGNDQMNGDDGGDWLFGADGADVIWGGRGDPDPSDPDDPGTTDAYIYGSFIDVIFGGHGGGDVPWVPEGADVLDFRPVTGDPASWFEMTGTGDGDVTDNQHHQGVDWIYGGYDRDVMQGDIGRNGPEEFGDRLIDWVGNYNLYLRCNASYGDDGDVRQRAPAMEEFLETLAFITGVGDSVVAVETPGSSAYRELGLVYKADTRDNNGSPFPGTPGHFDDPNACAP